MWKLGNNFVVVLVSVLSGCTILYAISTTLVGIILSLILVVYICVTLLSDECLVTRHASTIIDYFNKISNNFYITIETISLQTSGYVLQLFEAIKTTCKNFISLMMERQRRNTYQLSSDSYPRSSELSLVKGLSPIPRRNPRLCESENNLYERGVKVTSTPVAPWRREVNGDISGDSRHLKRSPEKNSFASKDETVYSAQESSPWGTTISPKIRPRAAGVKTVQTVAGPLLASTRYNIDTKVYADVTSPGLTSRLTRYATEANTKLMQSHYGTGQFPRVNLNSSPIMLLSPKSGKMRLPVTVRIAPPETRYSPPERQRILSDICQSESPKTPPSVAQVLREISLKRHASREDVAAELIKKQRTDGVYGDELENLEEMTQKRARDESSRSDEDISVDNTTQRPTKRTKKRSCYDIINSLSSSTNVGSGVKRKADISRSGTPDAGKHFKSFDPNQSGSGSPKVHPDHQVTKAINERESPVSEAQNSLKKLPEASPKVNIKSIVKNAPQIQQNEIDTRNLKTNTAPVKLTDRLFMKEEPQNIEKLKTLIDEHSSLSPKFSSDDGDEIKKSDIINMRQTSMKAKLKSMFDAISGKTANTIDPSVVIQAEPITPASTSPPTLTTLSSSTSTTNVNTSPISTSAVIPIIGKPKTQGTPGKHVTFNLTSEQPMSAPAGQPQERKAEAKKSESSLPTFSAPAPIFAFGSNFSSSTTPTASSQMTFGGFSAASTSPTGSAPSLFTSVSSASAAITTPARSQPQSTVAAQVSAAPTFSFVAPASTATSSSQSAAPSFAQTPQKSDAAASTAATTPVTATSLFGTPKGTSHTATSSSSSTWIPANGPATNGLLSFGGTTSSTPAAKPTAFAFGATSTAPSTTATTQVASTAVSTTTTGFSFGAGTTVAPAFGTTTATTSAFANAITSTTAQSAGFAFGSPAAKPFSFGAGTTQPSGSTGTLTFSTATATSAFGTPSTTAAFGTPTTTSTFATPTTTSAFATPTTSAFNAAATSTPLTFGPPATSAPAFGTPATTAAPAFGTPSTQAQPPSFGAENSAYFGNTPTTSIFGTPSTQGSAFTATPGTGLFFGTPKTTAPPAFGTTTASTTPSLFSGVNTNTITTSLTIFNGGGIFGPTKPSSAFGTTTTPSGFGNSTSFGTTTPSLFGGQPTTTAGFGTTSTTTPAFGSQTSVPAFGNPSTTSSTFANNTAPSFGNSAPSIFSAQNQGTVFNSATPTFGATTSAPPAFGTATSSTSGFGTTTASAFGTPTTAPPAFGSTTSSFTGFGAGSTTSPFGSTTPAFGTPSATPAFGAGGSNGTFAFGGNPSTSAQTQPQQNSIFSFGDGTSPGTFQFGNSAPQTGGFNFSGTGAPGTSAFSSPTPAFGAPSGGGMFSIGSGSTAPRSKSTRQGRRQR